MKDFVPVTYLISRQLFQNAFVVGVFVLGSMLPGLATAENTLQQGTSLQPSSAVSKIKYQLPAGSLGNALSLAAQQAGVAISFNGKDVEGVTVSALNGYFDINEVFSRLLADTHLGVKATASGYVLVNKQGDLMTLNPVQVNFTGLNELKGTYAAGPSSAATRLNLSLRDTPQSVSVISNQQIEDQNLSTLLDVLEQTPGVVTDRFDERISFTSRGFDLGYLIDGVPTFSFNSVAGESSMISTAVYDRVEVVRGAAGLLNGVGTPGGSINLVRKRPTKEFVGGVSAGLGSWDRYSMEADLSGALNEGGSVRGRMVASLIDGDSFTDDKERKEEVLYGIVEVDVFANTTLAAGFEYQKTSIEGANFGQTPLFYSNGARTNFSQSFNSSLPWSFWGMTTRRLFVDLDHQLASEWSLKVSSSYTKSERERFSGDMYVYPADIDQNTGNTTIDLGSNPADGVNKSLDAYLTGPFELFGRSHEAAIGFNYNDYKYEYRNDGAVQGSFDTRIVNLADFGSISKPNFIHPLNLTNGRAEEKAVYAAGRFSLSEPLSVLVGGRFTWYESDEWFRLWTFGLNGMRIDTPGIDENKVFTPYLGLTYELTPEYSVYASYTDIFQPNTQRNRGNQVLDPKRGVNIEFGVKGEHIGGRLNSSFAVFQAEEDNVAVVDSGAPLLPDGSQPYRAVKGALSEGFEVTLAGEIMPDWHLMAGYTAYLKRHQEGKTLDPTKSRRLFRLSTNYRLPSSLNKLVIGGNLRYQSRIYFDEDYGAGRVKQGGLTLLGLMARYELTPQLSVSANIDNLTDKKYFSGLGGYNGYTQGAPRNAWLKVDYSF